MIAPLVMLCGNCIRYAAQFLPIPVSVPAREISLAAICFLFVAVEAFPAPPRGPLGYSHVANVLRDPAWPGRVFLVCSDADGEGAFVEEVALGERRPNRYVLRGSKVLSVNQWDALIYNPVFSAPEKLLAYLDSVPVDAVVIDGSAVVWAADRDLLLQALGGAPDKWRLAEDIAASPVSRRLTVYRRIGGALTSDAPPNLQVDMRFSLGRTLQVK
jgi:hypothetical protein